MAIETLEGKSIVNYLRSIKKVMTSVIELIVFLGGIYVFGVMIVRNYELILRFVMRDLIFISFSLFL